MALSEQEKQLLAALERDFYANNADKGSAGAGVGIASSRTLVLAVLMLLVGAAVLCGGVMLQQTLVGVLGFVIMLAAALMAMRPKKASKSGKTNSAGQAKPGKTGGAAGFTQRLEARWQQRQDGQR